MTDLKQIADRIRDWCDDVSPGEEIKPADVKGLRKIATELEKMSTQAAKGVEKEEGPGFFASLFGTDDDDNDDKEADTKK